MFRGSFIFRGRKPYGDIVVTIIFTILCTLFVDDKGGENVTNDCYADYIYNSGGAYIQGEQYTRNNTFIMPGCHQSKRGRMLSRSVDGYFDL